MSKKWRETVSEKNPVLCDVRGCGMNDPVRREVIKYTPYSEDKDTMYRYKSSNGENWCEATPVETKEVHNV